jgi:hypothetical protein
MDRPEELADELAEVDALLGDEVERELAAVPLVLGVDDLHRQLLLADLGLAELQRLLLLLPLADEHPARGSARPGERTDGTHCASFADALP